MNETDAVQSLEQLRDAERTAVSRILHDEVGPSLCSAGMMLGLLRTETSNLPPESREWLDTLQTAMESAVESIRSLSYRSDPALARRCGLQTALEYLVRGTRVSLDCTAGHPKWTVAQNETACRIVLDIILAIPGQVARLETSEDGLTLFGAGPLGLNTRQREVLSLVAKLYQLELLYEVPMKAAIFSLGLLKVN